MNNIEYPICMYCGAVLKSGVCSCIRCTNDPTREQKRAFKLGYIRAMQDITDRIDRDISDRDVVFQFGYKIAVAHFDGDFSDDTGYAWAFSTRMLDLYEKFYGQSTFAHPEASNV